MHNRPSHPRRAREATSTPFTERLSDAFARLDCELNEFQSAIQTPKARAAALATVDQDIDAVKRLMISIFTRRNMLVPISMLPTEIFARIFHFVALSESHYSLDWIRVTNVCRRWRQIAIDDSTLWTHFSTSFSRWNNKWIARRLFRARNAPLIIDLNGVIRRDTLSLFPPHISHTRELYLHSLTLDHSKIVHEINIHKAPALEHLELTSGAPTPVAIQDLVGRSFFKGGPLPNLRIFRVSGTIFPWSRVPCGRLTQLKVTLTKVVFAVTPKVSQNDDLKQFIDLLVNCQSLEVLALENCLPVMLSETSGGQTIHLPQLSRLCLSGSSSRVTNLLKVLKPSSLTRLHLKCTSENANGYLILPFISAYFNDHTPVKFHC